MNVRWSDATTNKQQQQQQAHESRLVPTEIALMIGADQIYIHSNKKQQTMITINGYKHTHVTYVHDIGNLVMKHPHDNSNTTMEIIHDDDKKIQQILIMTPLFAIRIDIDTYMTLSCGILSHEWITHGADFNSDMDMVPLDGLLGATWHVNNRPAREQEYEMTSLWSTEGVHTRYRDDMYNHIDG